MSTATVSRQDEWSELGAVRRIVPCPDCGGFRRDMPGPHSPRWNSAHVLVDCAGRPVGDEWRVRREVVTAHHPPEVHPRAPEAPAPELQRVSERIGAAIVAFARAHLGETFHADDLRRHVRAAVGEVAPDSASRILRDLRQQGVVAYELVSRAKSLYRITAVSP